MSQQNSRPAYPVRGFIISGDPTTTVSVSGCRKLSATETSIRRVAAPGSANRYTTSALKSTSIKSIGDRNRSFMSYNSSEPSTSKVSNVYTEYNLVKNPISGRQTKFAAHVSKYKQEDHINHNSRMFDASLSVSPITNSASTKHKSPSKRAFTSRRSAYKIMNRFGGKPDDELTEKERNSLQWAKTIIEGLNRPAPPAIEDEELSSNSAPKRRRTAEESSISKPTQSTNTQPRPQARSYKDLAKDRIIWAIIDRSNSDGTISASNWKSVVTPAITAKFLKIIRDNPGPPPQCEDVGWYQGHIKLIACADEHSAQMYKSAVESLGELWPGAKLQAIPLANVEQRPRSIGKFPAMPSDPKEILEILKVSNPQLPTWNWKVVQVHEAVGGTRKATVILNSDSLPLLRKTEGKVFYGFGTVVLKVYKSDEKNTPQAPERIINHNFGIKHSSTSNEYFPSVSRLVGEWDDNCEDIKFTVIDYSEGYST